MRDNKLVGIASALVALSSALAIVLSTSNAFGPRLDPAPHEAAGRVLARRTISLLKPGSQVTVISRDNVTFQNPASDILFAAFRKELSKARVKIDSVQSIQIDPLRPVAVPAGDFFQCIKTSANGAVIVSLMGPPVLTEAQLAQLGPVNPAIVAFCSGPVRDQVDLRALFAQGLLKAAVVSKRHDLVARGPAKNEQEAFDRQFVEITAANLAALSSLSP
jgi:hypothetical protein